MEQKKIEKLLNVIYKDQGYVKLKDPHDIDKYVGYSGILESPFTSILPIVEIECNFIDDDDYITISIILPFLGFTKSIDDDFRYEDESSVLGRKLLRILEGCKIPGHILKKHLDDYILCIRYGTEED